MKKMFLMVDVLFYDNSSGSPNLVFVPDYLFLSDYFENIEAVSISQIRHLILDYVCQHYPNATFSIEDISFELSFGFVESDPDFVKSCINSELVKIIECE